MVRDFVPNQGLKSADILCVFQGFQTAELVQKSHQLPQVILLLVALNNGGGHKPLNSAVAKVLRVSYDPLGERSGSMGTPCCRTGFCVRRNKEPICDSQIRWIRASVLPIRRVDCCCSPIGQKLTVHVCTRTTIH